MAKKKKAQSKIENLRDLKINEMLLFSIQASSGDSIAKILTYFHEIMEAQIAKLESKIADEHDIVYYKTANTGNYGNTDIYFVITTQRTCEMDHNARYNGNLFAQSRVKSNLWKCSVNFPSKMAHFNDNKLKTILAEYVMIGDSATVDAVDPRTKPQNIKKNLKNLKTFTESTEE